MPVLKNYLKVATSIGLLAISSSSSFAGIVELYHEKYLNKKAAQFRPSSIKEKKFPQIINHKKISEGTFQQRYYIDESYGSKSDSPVFLYICGESECSSRYLNGAIREYARKYNAKLIALEHRYYGKSLPRTSFSAEDLKDLSTEAALDDLAYFQRTIGEQNHWTGKWVAFGGSYPGSLSAYYRMKYPDMVVGALASSAPVMAKEDFFEYDAHVTKVAGPDCASNIRKVVKEVEEALNQPDPKRINEIKSLFEASKIQDDNEFLYLIADVAAGAVQYGMHQPFCKALAENPMEGYATMTKYMYEMYETNAVDMTSEGAMSEDPTKYESGVGMRQWLYQSCTEYGYWQNAHPDPKLSTRSSRINLEFHHKMCKKLFGLDAPANIKLINQNYYYPLLQTSTQDIFFTNGSNDPGQTYQ